MPRSQRIMLSSLTLWGVGGLSHRQTFVLNGRRRNFEWSLAGEVKRLRKAGMGICAIAENWGAAFVRVQNIGIDLVKNRLPPMNHAPRLASSF